MSDHTCHAEGCNVPTEARFLMCRRHWAMVPGEIKAQVWKFYRPGQEIDKRPSTVYRALARLAVAAVAGKEGRPIWRELHAEGSKLLDDAKAEAAELEASKWRS